MTNEIGDRTKSTNPQPTTKREFVQKWAEEGMIAVQINATFFGLMTPKNMEDAGGTALSVGITEINPKAVNESVEQAGHSEVTLRGGTLAVVKAGQVPQNILQRLPDQSLLHIIPVKNQESLIRAQRPATISAGQSEIPGGEAQIRIEATIFSTSATPDPSVISWFEQPGELKPAA